MSHYGMFSDSDLELVRDRGYLIFDVIGEGSYSKVVKAQYTSKDEKGRTVVANLACKVIDKKLAPPLFAKKFLPRELDIIPRLSHPHIIHLHSMFKKGGKFFLFMRQGELGDVLGYLMEHGECTEIHARHWSHQVATAVQYLHTQDICHRDLKLENLFVTNNLNVKVGDFDFARYTIDAKGVQIMSETYCGSLAYAAPEVLRGTPYDPKMSDVWSLGCILFAMLNKRMPFPEEALPKLYEMQMRRKFMFKKSVQGVLSNPVKYLVYRLLEPTVNKRYTVDEYVDCDWFKEMGLSAAEKEALEQAKRAKERTVKTRYDIFGREGDKELVALKEVDNTGMTSTLNEELAAEAAKSVAVRISRSLRPPFGASDINTN